jgi:hypothetical protein
LWFIYNELILSPKGSKVKVPEPKLGIRIYSKDEEMHSGPAQHSEGYKVNTCPVLDRHFLWKAHRGLTIFQCQNETKLYYGSDNGNIFRGRILE